MSSSSSSSRLKDKVAVVTGAANGIGKALAIELARRQMKGLALSDIDAAGAEATAKECRSLGAVDAQAYALDVSSREAVTEHAREVAERFGQVNLVVNNAGVALIARVEEMTWSDFEWVMNVNFWGVMHGSIAFLPHLIASKDGHLVNVSSIFGVVAAPYQSAYCAAKFAVRGFSDTLRHEMRLAKRPMTVTTVHPGGIRTTMATRARFARSMNRDELTARFNKIASTSAEEAGRVIAKGIEQKKTRILVGADAHALTALERVLGESHAPVIRTIVSRMM